MNQAENSGQKKGKNDQKSGQFVAPKNGLNQAEKSSLNQGQKTLFLSVNRGQKQGVNAATVPEIKDQLAFFLFIFKSKEVNATLFVTLNIS